MQKTFSRESYALSPEEELSLFLTKKCVPVIKKPVMITLLPERFFKNIELDPSYGLPVQIRKSILKARPAERYYSCLTPSKAGTASFSAVVRDDRKDVLRISLVHMAIYELYLFALGLPADYPTEQIIAYGHGTQYIPCKVCTNSAHDCEDNKYSYELAIPAYTKKEVYRQRILKDLNEYFGLTVKLEKLTIVKDSRKLFTIDGESVELIWEEQLILVMRTKRGLVAELSKNQVTERI